MDLQKTTSSTSATTPDTRGGVGSAVGEIGRGLFTFALVEGLFILLLGGMLVAAVVWFTADVSAFRTTLAVIVTLMICVVVGVGASAAFAVARTVARMLQQVSLGDKIVGMLVEPLIKRGSQLLTVALVRDTLRDRGRALAAYLAEQTPLPVRWLARLLGLVIARMTLVQLLRKCRSPEGGIDPVKIRRMLGSSLDEMLIDQVRSTAWKVTMGMAVLATALSLAIAWVVTILPGTW